MNVILAEETNTTVTMIIVTDFHEEENIKRALQSQMRMKQIEEKRKLIVNANIENLARQVFHHPIGDIEMNATGMTAVLASKAA